MENLKKLVSEPYLLDPNIKQHNYKQNIIKTTRPSTREPSLLFSVLPVIKHHRVSCKQEKDF